MFVMLVVTEYCCTLFHLCACAVGCVGAEGEGPTREVPYSFLHVHRLWKPAEETSCAQPCEARQFGGEKPVLGSCFFTFNSPKLEIFSAKTLLSVKQTFLMIRSMIAVHLLNSTAAGVTCGINRALKIPVILRHFSSEIFHIFFQSSTFLTHFTNKCISNNKIICSVLWNQTNQISSVPHFHPVDIIRDGSNLSPLCKHYIVVNSIYTQSVPGQYCPPVPRTRLGFNSKDFSTNNNNWSSVGLALLNLSSKRFYKEGVRFSFVCCIFFFPLHPNCVLKQPYS